MRKPCRLKPAALFPRGHEPHLAQAGIRCEGQGAVVQGRVYSTLDARSYFARGRNSALFQAVQS